MIQEDVEKEDDKDVDEKTEFNLIFSFITSFCSIVVQCLNVGEKVVGSNPVKDYLFNMKNQNSRIII